VLPAKQSLKTNQTSRVDIDSRLVVQDELISDQGMPQAKFQFVTLLELGVQRTRVKLETTAAAALIKRLASVPESG
jgi:hypothetical protein